VEILTQVEQQIGWLSLNRPAMRNAISKSMWDSIPAAITAMRAEGARVVIFQGEGGAFAAGADLTELQGLRTDSEARDHWLSIRTALNAVAACELPTIAMIQGACMGGGCLLAAACDLRLCEPSASFSVPVAQLGIILDDDNISRLLSLVGRGGAAEMLLTAGVIDASRAEQLGLVNRVVPPQDLKAETVRTALRILANADGALRHTKRAIMNLSNGLAGGQSQSAMIASYLSDEFRKRVSGALSRNSTPE
jgi:enoyl-CoA hydratase